MAKRKGPQLLTDASRRLAFIAELPDDISEISVDLLNSVDAVDISCLVTAANFQLGATGDDAVTDPALCSPSNSSVPGRTNYEAAMDFYRWRNDEDDVAWNTFTHKGLHGYLVQRIGQVPEGQKAHKVPWAVDDQIQVYEVITNTQQILSPADAGFEKFRQVFSVQDDVDERAVVVAAGGGA